ncbi:MAG TPA: 6,7-dimethyl-8-ribityllumazine synthase [Hanamia sp.]|nr:6,7-dimethyl-8-ribityllumazine synthase [Hanamia sp.]
MATVSEILYNINKGILPKDAFIVIVRTQWNPVTVDKLLEGCIRILEEYGLNNYKVVTVPGAFEIPFAIKSFWENHKDNSDSANKPEAFIALGCVLRGGTPHFEYVSRAVTDGILQLNLMLPVPTIFGILTLDNQQQADERTGGVHGHKGEEAALSALKMIELKYAIS